MKRHLCTTCGGLVPHKVEPRGYWGWLRVVCPFCKRTLGDPGHQTKGGA